MDFDLGDNIVFKREILFPPECEKVSINDEKKLHIAYGIDNKFVMPMGVAILSILENNKNEDFVFHVLTEDLTVSNIQYLRELADDHKVIFVIHYIRAEVFDQLPATEHFTKATYNRFLLTKALKNMTKRVIYLDADILCYGSISELKSLDFRNNIVAVVQDIETVAGRQISKLNLKNHHYFNAGFLYIDIEQWELNHISEKALQVSFANLGKLKWLDQDALNIVLNDKALFIDTKYDYIFDFGLKENYHINQIPDKMVFIHYAGRYKPWQEWCMHPLKQDFIQYFNHSPWQHTLLIQPRTYKEMKRMAKSYWIYGRWGKALWWYAKYSYNKMKKVIKLNC